MKSRYYDLAGIRVEAGPGTIFDIQQDRVYLVVIGLGYRRFPSKEVAQVAEAHKTITGHLPGRVLITSEHIYAVTVRWENRSLKAAGEPQPL